MKRMGGVIAAAGLSSRMGKFKPMLPFEDSTIAGHIVSMLKQIGAEPIVMVTGYRADDLEEHLKDTGIRFLKNDNYEKTQMFDSICMGIRAIAAECDKIMIMPVDTPAIRPETFRQVMRIDADMVRTFYGGKPGHPILLRTETALALCEYKGDGGLRGAMENSGISITNLMVDDKGVNWDVDTLQEYQEMIDRNYHRENGYPVHPVIQVKLASGEPFFTAETARLIEDIDRTGSIQEACIETGISYSKGTCMVKKAEKQLGFPILERRTGGIGGGGSRLTKDGRKLITSYLSMQNQIQKVSEKIFKENFAEDLRS